MSKLDPSLPLGSACAVKQNLAGRKALRLNCTCFERVLSPSQHACLTQRSESLPKTRCCFPTVRRGRDPVVGHQPRPPSWTPRTRQSTSWLRGTIFSLTNMLLGYNVGEEAFSSVWEGTG